MNYELASELAEAGFPQQRGHAKIYPDGVVLIGQYGGRGVDIPTLEELIEACGDLQFQSLTRYSLTKWRAYAKRGGKGNFILGKGSTPSEAVARLWLALNKK